MTYNDITTLQELADYINLFKHHYPAKRVMQAIQKNNWFHGDGIHNICHDGKYQLILLDNHKAVVSLRCKGVKRPQFCVQWSPMVSGCQQPLECLCKGWRNLTYQYYTYSITEALQLVKNELEVTSLTKIDDLDFVPSTKEFDQNATYLEIFILDDENEIVGEVDDIECDAFWMEVL